MVSRCRMRLCRCGGPSARTAADGWFDLVTTSTGPVAVSRPAWESEEVVWDGSSGFLQVEPGAILRPWLQAFWWTNAQIRGSIQAAEDRDVGWILWNAVSNFSRSAIPTDAEVAGS